MIDLEREIADALRARGDAVTVADLRYPDAPRPRGPRVTRLIAALAAAAMIAALAVGLGLWTGGSSGHSHAGATPALADRRWRLVDVAARGESTPIPASLAAVVEFQVTGDYSAYDGLNTTSGTYRATAAGLVVQSSATTAVGSVDPPAVAVTAQRGIAAVFVVDGDRPVAVDVNGERLVLAANGTTLRFEYLGRALDPGAPEVRVEPASTPP